MTAVKKTIRKRGRPSGKTDDDSREKLIEAAEQTFRTIDPVTLTRKHFADTVGIDPNLIRYYFGDMEQLKLEVVSKIHRSAEADKSAMAEAEPLERLRYRIKRTLSLFVRNPYHHKLVVTSLIEDTSQQEYREWVEILEKSLADLKDVIAKGMDAGVLTETDARFLHFLIISAAEFWASNKSIVQIFFSEDVDDALLDRYGDWIFETLVSGLRPRADDTRKSVKRARK